MWLDRSLRWGRHINEVSKKVLKFINIFKVLAGSSWGVHPKHLRLLYISLIRSRIDYASFFYDNSANIHLGKLDRIQNQFMRIIGSFIKTTPIHVMESEVCLQPLFLRRRYLAGKFWLKTKSRQTNSGGLNIISKLASLFDTSRYWLNKKTPALILVHNYLKHFKINSSKKLGMFSLNTLDKLCRYSIFY